MNDIFNKSNLTRAGIAGAVMGVLAILMFGGLWLLLGSLEVHMVVRLVLSVCLPPALLTLLVGGYMLYNRPG